MTFDVFRMQFCCPFAAGRGSAVHAHPSIFRIFMKLDISFAFNFIAWHGSPCACTSYLYDSYYLLPIILINFQQLWTA